MSRPWYEKFTGYSIERLAHACETERLTAQVLGGVTAGGHVGWWVYRPGVGRIPSERYDLKNSRCPFCDQKLIRNLSEIQVPKKVEVTQ